MKKFLVLLLAGAVALTARAQSSPTVSIPWRNVSKSGSSLADLSTRSASDLNSGTLAAARLPSYLQGAISPGGDVNVGNNIIFAAPAAAGYRYILSGTNGSGTGGLRIQAGGGSSSWGGTLNLYETAHATRGGWATVGIGVAGAKFTINSGGFADGTEVFTVDRGGDLTTARNAYIGNAFFLRGKNAAGNSDYRLIGVTASNAVSIDPDGTGATFGGSAFIGASSYLGWTGRGFLLASSDGVWRMSDNAGTNFNRLQFGGTTSSYPALKRSLNRIAVVQADDGGYVPIIASDFFGQGTTESTNTTTGSITTAGGVGIAKRLYVGGRATFSDYAYFVDKEVFFTRSGIQDWAMRTAASGNFELVDWTSTLTRFSMTTAGAATFTNNVTANRIEVAGGVSGGGLTAGKSQLGGSATNGAEIAGYGSAYDAVLMNRNGTVALGVNANSNSVTAGGIIIHKNYTVAALPPASANTYGTCFVVDATQSAGTSLGAAPTGGGGTVRMVYSNGTSWLLL